MSQEVFINSFSVPNAAAGTCTVLIAPASTQGGGVTIEGVSYTNGSAAGTVPFTLLKYSSAGTPALNGTVATTGGTVVATAPLVFTMGPNNYISAGESVKLAWTGGGTPTADAALTVQYKMGREAV
jgi:hypothetical protein